MRYLLSFPLLTRIIGGDWRNQQWPTIKGMNHVLIQKKVVTYQFAKLCKRSGDFWNVSLLHEVRWLKQVSHAITTHLMKHSLDSVQDGILNGQRNVE